ncbi:unnamed protein product, partial [Mesorhabditis spiculigera]
MDSMHRYLRNVRKNYAHEKLRFRVQMHVRDLNLELSRKISQYYYEIVRLQAAVSTQAISTKAAQNFLYVSKTELMAENCYATCQESGARFVAYYSNNTCQCLGVLNNVAGSVVESNLTQDKSIEVKLRNNTGSNLTRDIAAIRMDSMDSHDVLQRNSRMWNVRNDVSE